MLGIFFLKKLRLLSNIAKWAKIFIYITKCRDRPISDTNNYYHLSRIDNDILQYLKIFLLVFHLN